MKLEKLTTSELVSSYNEAAVTLKERTIKRFADRKTAVRRTTEIVNRLPKEAKKTARRPRGMRFVFKPEREIRECKSSARATTGDKRTLRQRAVGLLLQGATFSEVEDMVMKFDRDRGVPTKNLERRAYELIRLVHYYLGYGLRQEDTGKIFAYTKE